MNDSPAYDVVTLGETMIRLTPPGTQRLEQSDQWEVFVGGSESNTAVGLARLGWRVLWSSRLTDQPAGRWIASRLAAHGVDTSKVVWTPEDRVGTYYFERGAPPRQSEVYYDRAGSAASCMTPEIMSDLLEAAAMTRWFHTTGITLGISDSAAQVALNAAQKAAQAGASVSFDFNYRSKMWGINEARSACAALAQVSNFLFLPWRDAKLMFALEAPCFKDVLQSLGAMFPSATVVMTLGEMGSACRTPEGEIVHEPAIATTVIERLGGGDAFSAGFIDASLRGSRPAEALRSGNACAALKYTIPGDLPLIDRQMVLQTMQSCATSKSSVQR